MIGYSERERLSPSSYHRNRSLTPFIVLFMLVWDFFDQFAWWNPEHFSELAQGDGGGCVEGVRVDAFNRLVGDICLSLQFAHTDAFFPGNLFDSYAYCHLLPSLLLF